MPLGFYDSISSPLKPWSQAKIAFPSHLLSLEKNMEVLIFRK